MRFAMILGCTVATLFAALLTSPVQAENLTILQQWQGRYLVANFDHFPKGQRESGTVVITDEKQWATLWEGLDMKDKPAELPEVDFHENLVLFERNTRFVNGLTVTGVKLTDGHAEVSAATYLLDVPITDVVYGAAVVVPRRGIRTVGKVTLPKQRP